MRHSAEETEKIGRVNHAFQAVLTEGKVWYLHLQCNLQYNMISTENY